MVAYQRLETDTLTSWEVLRKTARSLEQQIDSKLINLDNQESELPALLQSLDRVCREMGVWTERNPAYTHLHSRHLANLFEYNREFSKTIATLQQQQDHSELLTGAIYSRTGASHANQHTRMDQSHIDVDDILT